MAERLPQRFRWKERNDSEWEYEAIMPGHTMWHIQCGVGSGMFESDPWEVLGLVLGGIAEFEWIDNDYGWCGDLFDWNEQLHEPRTTHSTDPHGNCSSEDSGRLR